MILAQSWAGERLIKAETRTLIWSEPLVAGGNAIVKLYRRRGAFEPLRRLVVPFRVEREFALLARLHAVGVACPEPLWWSQGWNARHGRHELLATREIVAAEPLKLVLRRSGQRQPDLAPLFALARRIHDAGISHGAFYPANILASQAASGELHFHVLDLAQGCRFSRAIVGSRPADFDLLDMLRAIERVAPIDDRSRWLAEYGTGRRHVARLLGEFESHRIERPWRHLRRAETDARAAGDRVLRAMLT